MNRFLISTKRQIAKHGIDVDFISVQEGTYDVDTSIVVNTETTTTIKAYPVTVVANQYNFPNLIGREVIKFLIAGDALTTKPAPMDKLVYKSNTYTIEQQQDYTALGEVCMQHLIAVKT